MLILGIETSCDETAAAVVENGWNVLSNVIASSQLLHVKTGGVVPEVAARDSAMKIAPVIKDALVKSGASWKRIDAVAVANGPGLLGSLLVGIESAKTLAMLYKKPLIPVYHIAGHLFSNILERKNPPSFPVVSLTVSGGHNDLYLWKSPAVFEKLGGTNDDAAGEAFDKGARLLGLPYPGGPSLAKIALKGKKDAVHFPRPMEKSGNYEFSFSGLKTALYYEIEHRTSEKKLSNKEISDLSASYQEAIVDTLIDKLFRAVDEWNAGEVHLAGGVSANKRLREKFEEEAEKRHLSTRIPEKLEYCTDNGAMIAAAAFGIYSKSSPTEKKRFTPESVDVNLSHDFRF